MPGLFQPVTDLLASLSSSLYMWCLNFSSSLQVMSIEEVERIMDETQDAVEYQRVCIASMCFPGMSLKVHCVLLLYQFSYPFGCSRYFVVPSNFLFLDMTFS